eukprot:scaffold124247_cov45-Phaeocystis_antarctica.AAC.1
MHTRVPHLVRVTVRVRVCILVRVRVRVRRACRTRQTWASRKRRTAACAPATCAVCMGMGSVITDRTCVPLQAGTGSKTWIGRRSRLTSARISGPPPHTPWGWGQG